MREIHNDELPCLFQDAVHMTSDLGFRYLWIDVLCIAQDDPEDWSRELPKLPDYFVKPDTMRWMAITGEHEVTII